METIYSLFFIIHFIYLLFVRTKLFLNEIILYTTLQDLEDTRVTQQMNS